MSGHDATTTFRSDDEKPSAKRKARIEVALGNDLVCIMTAFLTSGATTWLRACSRTCAGLFVRNCPGATTSEEAFFVEALESPLVSNRVPMYFRAEDVATEVPSQNIYSPLRCWRVSFGRVRIFLSRSSPHATLFFRTNKDFLLAAVGQSPRAHSIIHRSLWSDREFVLAVVAKNGSALEFAADLKSDRDVVLAAVTQSGSALWFADESLKRDRDVVSAAVAQNGNAIYYADESLKRDRDVVLAAVSRCGYALQHAHDNLKADRDVVLAAVTQNGDALKYADESLRRDPGVLGVATPGQKPRASK